MKITKDMNITEVVQKYPETIEVFLYAGMGCFGCHVAQYETVEQGAMAHGIDVDALVDALNEIVDAVEADRVANAQ